MRYYYTVYYDTDTKTVEVDHPSNSPSFSDGANMWDFDTDSWRVPETEEEKEYNTGVATIMHTLCKSVNGEYKND
jgi:hypothetical protein